MTGSLGGGTLGHPGVSPKLDNPSGRVRDVRHPAMTDRSVF